MATFGKNSFKGKKNAISKKGVETIVEKIREDKTIEARFLKPNNVKVRGEENERRVWIM